MAEKDPSKQFQEDEGYGVSGYQPVLREPKPSRDRQRVLDKHKAAQRKAKKRRKQSQ